jgi:serine phosphatase RsbU (regulator of sigma subunit)
VPSDTVTGASGDWYDVLGLPDEKVAIVVGDAVGRGRPASRSKEVLQTAVRRLAAGGARPGEVIAHLRQMIGPFDDDLATLAYIEANASEQGEPGGRTGPVLARTAQGKRDRNLRRRG